MKNLEAYKNQLREIEALIDKLEKGELSLNELIDLEKATGELHEKSIILKYKAFESHVNEETHAPEEGEKEEIVEEESEGNPALEFSIFDDISTDEVDEEPAHIVESVVEEPVVVEEPESVQETILPVEREQIDTPSAIPSFWEKIKIEDNSLGSQFADAKLETLVGAFGLNQKLRYINDLFDGSSELFSDAIKVLDSQSDFESARTKVDLLASEHAWDPEEESVVEFLTFVNRRYA